MTITMPLKKMMLLTMPSLITRNSLFVFNSNDIIIAELSRLRVIANFSIVFLENQIWNALFLRS